MADENWLSTVRNKLVSAYQSVDQWGNEQAAHMGGPVYDRSTGQLTPWGQNVANGVLGFAGNGLNAGSTVNLLASKNPRMYNLPTKAGMADGANTGAVAGAYDAEGRSLIAPNIAGSTGSVGTGQVAISPSQLDAISAQGFGTLPVAVPSRQLPQGSVGVFRKAYDADTGLPSFQVQLDQGLGQASFDQVKAHEVAHGLDTIAGNIPTSGLQSELKSVYNLQNNPQTYGKPFGPSQAGYSNAADQQRELMAEAIRGYMTAPDTFKTIAPNTAAAIRGAINDHPVLSKIIQFNGAGGIAYGLSPATDDVTGAFETSGQGGSGSNDAAGGDGNGGSIGQAMRPSGTGQ